MTKLLTIKRVIALFICLFMLLSIALLTVSNVKAAEERPTFEQYKTTYYINYEPYKLYKLKEFNLPYRAIVEENRNNAAYLSLLAAWEISTFSLGDVREKSDKKVGCYEAFLYDILYDGQENSTTAKELEEFANGIEASSLNYLISVFNVDKNFSINTKIKDLTPEQLKKFVDGVQGIEDLKDALTILDDITEVIEFCSDCEDVINKLSKIEAIQKLGFEYAEILRQISSNTYDWALKDACEKMSKICDKSISYDNCVSIMIGDLAIDKVVDLMFDYMEDSVIEYLGFVGIGIKAGQAAGKLLGESLFASKSSIENYYEMAALYDFENELRNVVLKYENNYNLSKTEKNARLFNASFEMLMKTFHLGCDISAKYYKIAYLDGAVNSVLSFFNDSEEKYEKFKNSLDYLSYEISFVYKYANSNLYNLYLGLTDEEVIKAVGAMPVEIVDDYSGVKYDETTFGGWLSNFQSELEPYNWTLVSKNIKLNKDIETFASVTIKSGDIKLNGHRLITQTSHTATPDKH